MPIPDFQSFFAPVLRFAADAAEHTTPELRPKIAAFLALTPDELNQKLPSGAQTVFANRVAWAMVYLTRAGALKKVRRGVFQITERGTDLLKTFPNGIKIKQLSNFPEFVAFHKGDSDKAKKSVVIEATETPEEQLADAYQTILDALASDLLEAIKNGTPQAFEQIVVDLLVAMGYGGSVEDAGKVVGKSGDGGIDGIIKQDKLGLDAIYVQAKRWKDGVGSSEIMKFSGSLTKQHANRGVFITTSIFTKDATAFVEAMPQKIVLIDGKHLASLMIEHDVGVSTARTYTLKRLDQDYFDNV